MSAIHPRQRVRINAPGYEGKLGTTVSENGTVVTKWTGLTLKRWLVQVDGIPTPMTFVAVEISPVQEVKA